MSCGRASPVGARFCGGCGTPLTPRCPACGAESAADARFCVGCGAALAPSAVPAEPQAISRKVVTVVFADLIGSVALQERLDAESARRVMDRYHRAMTAAIEVHGGHVVQLLGDGVLAAFGVPRVAEDDAIRAVHAGVGMQRAFQELAREQGATMAGVGLRVAVNTGEIVVGDDENRVMGDPTNVAARLQQEARDGDVIVGEATQRLVGTLVTLAPLGSFALRGRSELVTAHRVVSLDRPASQHSIAFVGRDEELRRLVAVHDATVAAPGARLVVLLGSPGLGKSRLVAEFTRRAGERATVLSARCDAAGGATFAPLAEALRTLLRIDEGAGGDVLRAAIDAVVAGDEAERTRIATGIGALLAGTPAPPEETFFVVRRLLAALATVRPVVLVIDDLHWAEPLLLDLVEHLVQWSTGVPLLLLVAARPELRDTRSSLTMPGSVVADVVTLGGLDAGAATRLAASVIGGAELPAAVAGRVLATSEGNPLFVAELVRMLVQDGTLERQGDRWTTTVEIAKLDMPATIQVLLAARIERLRPEERSVLERAAVVGRQFSRAAVAQLLPTGAADLDGRLEALRRSELIEPDTGWFLGEPALRFHHTLIRDAAYRRVLKETRAELHERLADWITSRAGDSVEHDETVGWHLEQAHQNLRELGALDARAAALGERAARHLGAAGRRALAREDLALASGLLGRALDRLDPTDPTRADLALDWCEALLSGGEVAAAVRAIEELARFTNGSDRLRAWHTCFAGQLVALTDPQSLRTTAEGVARAANALAAAGDAAGEAKAHSVHATALARLGEGAACETALDKALAAARRARDRRRANAVLGGAPVAALWGPSPVTRASGRCLDVVRVLRITQGAPAVEAVALRCQAVLETLRGRGDAARRMIVSSRRMVEELGIAQQVLETDVFAGHIELLEGDSEAAEQCLRAAYEGLRERGLGIDAARAAALLGRALLAQDRAAEAEALSRESETLAGDDLKAAIAWRGVRAEALARRGDSAAAIELARAAVAIAAAMDALLDHAEARRALAAALRAAGRSADADAEEARAIELWEAKGATLLVERARRPESRSAGSGLPASGATGTGSGARRRVRANLSTAFTRRLNAVVAAHDESALADLWAQDAEILHHPTGTSYGREAAVETFRSAFGAATDLVFEQVPLASLGEALALTRLEASATAVRGDDYSFGGIEVRSFMLTEANARGQALRIEIFAEDHLADAVGRLYERYAELLPEGPEREQAAARARSIAVDLRDATVDDVATRVTDVHALRPDACLVSWTTAGTARESGGAVEDHSLVLRTYDAVGRLHHAERLEPHEIEGAFARFDELREGAADELTAARVPKRHVRPNAATANAARMDAAIAARDLDAFLGLLAGGARAIHHPTGAEYEETEARRAYEIMMRVDTLVFAHEPLATLGDLLALCRSNLSFGTASSEDLPFGASNMDSLVLAEVDASGRRRATEFFALEKQEDAVARLYSRHAELVVAGPAGARAALTARAVAAALPADLAAIPAALAPDVDFVDHRLLGLGTASGAEAYLRGLRSLFDGMRAGLETTSELVFADADALLVRRRSGGALREGGGAFEHEMLMLWVFGGDGRIAHIEMFEPDRDAEALARLDALTEPTPVGAFASAASPAHIENAATRAAERLARVLEALDRDGLSSLLSPRYRNIDRQKTAPLESDRAAYLEAGRAMLTSFSSSRVSSRTLATRGERHALGHVRWRAAGEAVGPVEFEWLCLIEVGRDGLLETQVDFVANEVDAARAELDARYHAGEAAPYASVAAGMREFGRAFAARDWDALAACCALDVAVQDHRRLGWETLHGPAAYTEALRALVELAPDTALRLDHVELCGQGYLVLTVWSGTRDGGAFEEPSLMVAELDAQGRIRRFDQYEFEAVEAARARFSEVAAAGTRDLLRIPATAATRAMDRFAAAVAARDWDGLADLLAPAFGFEDRRRGIRQAGDRAEMLASVRLSAAASATATAETLATTGEHLALQRIHFSGSDGDQVVWEVDVLQLVEVDTEGRLVATVTFDPDDRRAAGDELMERYARTDAARLVPARTWELARAMREHDLDRMRALLPDDFVFDDRRRAGAGRLGREEYLAWMGGLFEQSPDAVIEPLYNLSEKPYGVLSVSHTFGTRIEGGAFESVFVGLRGPFGVELYDLEDLDLARARFEELQRTTQRS